MTQRLQRHPYLALFDGPDTNTSTESRTSSVVPLQALYFMNSEFLRTASESLAQRLLKSSSDAHERIRLAHELAYSRPPVKEEFTRGLKYLEEYESELTQLNAPADRLELESWSSYARTILTANEFRRWP